MKHQVNLWYDIHEKKNKKIKKIIVLSTIALIISLTGASFFFALKQRDQVLTAEIQQMKEALQEEELKEKQFQSLIQHWDLKNKETQEQGQLKDQRLFQQWNEKHQEFELWNWIQQWNVPGARLTLVLKKEDELNLQGEALSSTQAQEALNQWESWAKKLSWLSREQKIQKDQERGTYQFELIAKKQEVTPHE